MTDHQIEELRTSIGRLEKAVQDKGIAQGAQVWVRDVRAVLSRIYELEKEVERFRSYPSTAPFWEQINDAKTALAASEAQCVRLKEALDGLIIVSKMDHGSMCPANRCTCDLDDTRSHRVRSAEAVLEDK